MNVRDEEGSGSELNPQLRTKVLESLLVEKGLVSTDALDKLATIYEKNVGPMNGAKVVARAWVDPGYRKQLLKDATGAIAELGFGGLQGEDMVVLENTAKIHNVVVCTRVRVTLGPCWVCRPSGTSPLHIGHE